MKSNLKVLRTIPSFYPLVTGPANQAWNISCRLHKRGINSLIITSTLGAESVARDELINNVHIRRLPMRSGYIQYSFMPLTIGAFLKEEYDIVHAHSYRNFLADAAFLTSKLKRKPFILQTHGTLLGYKYILKKRDWKLHQLYDLFTFKSTARRACAIITSTRQEFQEALEFGVEKSKLRIIPAGVELKQRAGAKKQSNVVRILFVGRIGRSRNIEQILYAFKQIAGNYEGVELYIVGGEAVRSYAEKVGYLAELKATCRTLEIDKQVVFTGFLSGDSLKNMYTSSDIFVYTSLYENLGQTLLEAGAAGLPIITTPVGIANDIVINDKTGYLVNFGDVEELTSQLSKLVDDESKRATMGRNIQAIIEKEYSWDRIMEAYIQLYQEMLDGAK